MDKEKETAITSLILKVYSDKTVIEYLERIKAHNQKTYIHSLNTGLYAALICLNLDLNRDYSSYIVKGALLHDIGKLIVPNSILDKDSTLTCEEYNIIKTHVNRTYVTDIPFLGTIVDDIIFMHHERIDGTGYPLGLKLDDMPLHSRIVQVADSYSAMTEVRPYGKKYDRDGALEELRSYGSYDPECIDALENALDQIKRKEEEVKKEYIDNTILSWAV